MVLTNKMKRSMTPLYVFLQMDICTLEKKNIFAFEKLGSHVARVMATEPVLSLFSYITHAQAH